MPTYARASDTAHRILDGLLEDHYPDLVEHEVTVGLLFAHATVTDAGEKSGPAIKHQGYPALGMIEVTPLKKRVAGLPDCIITIDGDQWSEWDEEQRRALIDHELFHLELLRDPESGDVKADDHGRPRMKCRLHDWQIGGFRKIAERYQNDAHEVKAAREFKTLFGQYVFDWAEGVEEETAPSPAVAKFPGAKRGRKPKPAPQPSA